MAFSSDLPLPPSSPPPHHPPYPSPTPQVPTSCEVTHHVMAFSSDIPLPSLPSLPPPTPQVPTSSEVTHLVMVFSSDAWHPDQLITSDHSNWRPFHHALNR